jgi:putative lipoic acid-binding regulatory protein
MKTEDFYIKLKKSLDETTDFPGEYLFKFIIPSAGEGEAIIEKSFDGTGAVITTRSSKKGNYTAISIVVVMPDSQSVIDKYKELSVIRGILPL